MADIAHPQTSSLPSQIHAFGFKPKTEFLASLDGALTEKNFVRVNEFLEVKGHAGVFALGDIIDWAEQKQAAKANGHSGVVAANVVSFVQGNPPKKAYKGSTEMILIPLGKVRQHVAGCVGERPLLTAAWFQRRGGRYIGMAWGIVVGDFMARTVKGKDLLTAMTRKARGL